VTLSVAALVGGLSGLFDQLPARGLIAADAEIGEGLPLS
jgi:hypothetical protein